MERQGKEITKVQRLLSDAESMWKDLPRLRDLQIATNRTLDAIVNSTESTRENDEKCKTFTNWYRVHIWLAAVLWKSNSNEVRNLVLFKTNKTR